MLEAEATADMLLMTQPFKAPSVAARRGYFMPKIDGDQTAANQ